MGNNGSSILPVPQGRYLRDILSPLSLSPRPHIQPISSPVCLPFKPYPDSDYLYPRPPTLYFFFFFWPCRAACGILVPGPGIEPMPPAVEAQSPNHWEAREVPTLYFQGQLKVSCHPSAQNPPMASHLAHSKSQSFQRPTRPGMSLALCDL